MRILSAAIVVLLVALGVLLLSPSRRSPEAHRPDLPRPPQSADLEAQRGTATGWLDPQIENPGTQRSVALGEQDSTPSGQPAATADQLSAFLQIRVIDETGAPIPLAYVVVKPVEEAARRRILEAGGDNSIHLSADQDGTSLVGVWPNERLRVKAHGFPTTTHLGAHRDLDALLPGETRELEIQLDLPAGDFRGRVLSRETGQPVQGAAIEPIESFPGGTPPEEHTSTDVEGRFRLPLEVSSFQVRAPGFAPAYASVDQVTEPLSREVVIRLERAASLSGRVVPHDPNRPEARVWVTGLGVNANTGPKSGFLSTQILHNSIVDPEGRFEVTGLIPDVPLQVEVRRGGRKELDPGAPLFLAPGEARELELQIGAPASIRVVARTEFGEPIADCPLRLFAKSKVEEPGSIPGSVRVHRNAVTDAQGRAVFEDVVVGDWLIAPALDPPDSNSNGVCAGAVVSVEHAGGDVSVELEFFEPRWIRGICTKVDGAPLGYVQVVGQGIGLTRYAQTSATGTYELGPLTPGTYRVSLRVGDAEGVAPAPRFAQAGDEGVNLTALPSAGLFIQLTDSAGSPVKSAHLSATRRDSLETRSLLLAGSQQLPAELPAGTYDLTVTTNSGQVAVALGVQVRPGEPRVVSMELEPAARVRVRLLAGDLEEIPCTIEVFRGPARLAAAEISPGGTRIFEVPPGSLVLRGRPTFSPTGNPTEHIETNFTARSSELSQVDLTW